MQKRWINIIKQHDKVISSNFLIDYRLKKLD
jgi:hypothetical protein